MLKRLFVAINLNNTTKLALAKIISQLPHHPYLNKTKIDNLHLTLQFLGDVEEAIIPELQTKIDLAIRNFPPFQIEFGRINAFPNLNHPSIIIMEVKSPQLDKLYGTIYPELRRLIPLSGAKPHRPHITLARLKSTSSLDIVTQIKNLVNQVIAPPPLLINHLDLMASTLTPQGSIYTIISRHRLG